MNLYDLSENKEMALGYCKKSVEVLNEALSQNKECVTRARIVKEFKEKSLGGDIPFDDEGWVQMQKGMREIIQNIQNLEDADILALKEELENAISVDTNEGAYKEMLEPIREETLIFFRDNIFRKIAL